jgi:hypothetical protein
VRDSFGAKVKVPYSRDALWIGFEVWRSVIGQRFKAAGGQGKQTQITMYWDEGGYSTRRLATELRDFARQEHLNPSMMESTVYNADVLESTLEVAVTATFWGQPAIEMSIHGHVRQDVVGLEVLLRQEVETEMRDERDRTHELAIPIHAGILADEAKRERPQSPSAAPTIDATRPERNVVRNWVVGAATTVGLGLVVAYFTHAFGWTR